MLSLRSLSIVVALAVVAPFAFATKAHADDSPKELGLELVPYSKKVGDKRYESPRDYEGTVKFFRDKWKSSKPVKWSREVSLPAVKYIHVESLIDATKWSGINIYQLPDGRVRYYVLDRVPPAATSSNAPAASSSATASSKP